MSVSSGMGADMRFKAVLKTRISPMLLVSTTDPLPAHRPWSGGSMSPRGLVGSEALSTAFRPLTPVAPPFPVLMRSQPGPSGWQLTDGTGKEGLWAASWRRSAAERRILRGSDGGMRCALDPWPVPSWWPDAAAAVDGVLTGPVRRWQLILQPVAAGPAKVGLNVPRFDEVTAVVWVAMALVCGAAAAGPPAAISSIPGRDSSDSSSVILWRMGLMECLLPNRPPIGAA